MISSIVSRLVILVFGTLYPAYASYKAVRTKNVKEYVKWMMYWIVFALFTCVETFTDVFLSWFPFYYEIKIILVLWLLSPATKGSSILYRKFVHPMLSRREQDIDDYISKAKEQGYHTVLNLGTKGVNYATTVIMQTAIKNLSLSSLAALPPSISDPSISTVEARSEPDMVPRSQSHHSFAAPIEVIELIDVEMSEDDVYESAEIPEKKTRKGTRRPWPGSKKRTKKVATNAIEDDID